MTNPAVTPNAFRSFPEIDEYLGTGGRDEDSRLPVPTIEELLLHARKFGIDQVWETALKLGVPGR